jgi:hypothetical protein
MVRSMSARTSLGHQTPLGSLRAMPVPASALIFEVQIERTAAVNCTQQISMRCTTLRCSSGRHVAAPTLQRMEQRTCLMQRTPSASPSSSLPLSGSSRTGTTPKNGRVADPGFSSHDPGSGVIMCPPVSVCMHTQPVSSTFTACNCLVRRKEGSTETEMYEMLHLPPCVDNRASILADDAVVPPPCLWVDRLPDRPKNLRSTSTPETHSLP